LRSTRTVLTGFFRSAPSRREGTRRLFFSRDAPLLSYPDSTFSRLAIADEIEARSFLPWPPTPNSAFAIPPRLLTTWVTFWFAVLSLQESKHLEDVVGLWTFPDLLIQPSRQLSEDPRGPVPLGRASSCSFLVK